jgi:LAS superfamily LD-carboxypeptidase LdcB
MEQPIKSTRSFMMIIIGLIAVSGVGLAGLFGYEIHTMVEEQAVSEAERAALAQQLASTTLAYEAVVANLVELGARFEDTTEELNETKEELEAEQNRNEEFENQIKDIAGTVGVLDRLAKTDKELLQKYSRVYFLNENYRPDRLTQISPQYVLPSRSDQYFQGDALPFLNDLLRAAERADLDMKIVSAFRSFDEQENLKGQFTQQYGFGANAFSADQGYSEHQLGTAVDFSTEAINGAYNSFANTPEYAWLLENAHRYGFVLSYPEGNAFYIFEPWHWRFVGVELATYLNRNNLNFYDMDQREIDTYLVNLFE